MDTPNFMIYGANGYTGRIITEMAVQRGYKPLLCGRNSAEISALAARYNLPYEIVSLDDKTALDDAVLAVDAVLHCAGPFSRTARPMLDACIRNKTHYLDITGEISVFEMAAQLDDAIKSSGITAMPGVGFDVVPTDCLAAYLKKKLPTATQLVLAVSGLGGGISHGTATTVLENLGRGGAVRLNGRITPVPDMFKVKEIIFDRKPVPAVCIPMGDVSMAYHSTGIPNIETYIATSSRMLRLMELSKSMNWLLKRQFFKNWIQKYLIDRTVKGPSDKQRAAGKVYIWGQVQDDNGSSAIARLITPEGYTLTALVALAAVEKVLKGQALLGFQTPSSAFGHNFIMEIRGVVRHDLENKRDIVVE